MEDGLNHSLRELVVGLRHHFFGLAEESLKRGLFFDGCVVLARLQHDDQVGEVVCLLATREHLLEVFLEVRVAEFFEDVEHHLRIYASHSECLKEPPHAFLQVTICVILSFQVLHEALLRSIVFASYYLRDFIQAHPPRVKQHFGSDFAHLSLVYALKCLLDRPEKRLRFHVRLHCNVTNFLFLC